MDNRNHKKKWPALVLLGFLCGVVVYLGTVAQAEVSRSSGLVDEVRGSSILGGAVSLTSVSDSKCTSAELAAGRNVTVIPTGWCAPCLR